MNATRSLLESLGLPSGDLHELPTSVKRFPDGAEYRIEIPSTEGPRCLDAVLDEGQRLGVPVHRVSQGSGAMLLSGAELDEMAGMAAGSGVEVSVFARPTASWGPHGLARTPGGAPLAGASHGQEGLVHGLEDILRAASHGFRSTLIADLGLLSVFEAARSDGLLPADMQTKMSAYFPIANPATARVLEAMGADTINVAGDLSLAELAAIRAAVDIPLDLYLEAPDALGGFVRFYEIADIIRVAAPVYVKFGLSNAANIYPSGSHVEGMAVDQSRARVRRAGMALELLEALGDSPVTSAAGCAGLAVPVTDPTPVTLTGAGT